MNAGDATVGKRLKEIPLPTDCVIVSLRRGGRVVVPRGETQLLAGDRVVALSDSASVEDWRRALRDRSDMSTE